MEELRKQIEKSYYWDARIKELNCNYFVDEVTFVFEGDKNEITYHFEECYKIKIEHAVDLLKKFRPENSHVHKFHISCRMSNLIKF